jgi:hypothetical protein
MLFTCGTYFPLHLDGTLLSEGQKLVSSKRESG